MSRWLVGSSSSSRSGCDTSARASSTRRRQPPDSVSTAASAGRSRCGHDLLHPLLEPPAVPLLEFVLQSSESLEARRRPLVGDEHRRVVVRRHQFAQVAEALGHDVEDRTGIGERRILLEPGRPQAGRPPDRTGVGRQLTAQHPQQRGLARPVPADHGHALAGFDLDARFVEERKVPEGNREAIGSDERHTPRLSPPRYDRALATETNGARWRPKCRSRHSL